MNQPPTGGTTSFFTIMDKTLTIGRTYAVTTSTTCDVTDANGSLVTTAFAGQQAIFVAPTTTVTFSDDSASVVAVFNLALAKPRLFEQLGEGKLPAGYLPARFLESTRNQFIVLSRMQTWTAWSLTTRRTNLDYAGAFRQGYFTNAEQNADIGVTHSGDSRGAYAAYLNASLYGGGELVGEPNSGLKRFTAGVDTARMVAYLGEQQMPITSLAVRSAVFYLFAIFKQEQTPHVVYTTRGAVYHLSYSTAESSVSLRPVIDPQGVPCMWDSIGKNGYYAYSSSVPGKFAIGMTAAQARRLWQLPADAEDKTLTVSLPAAIVDGETVTDSAVATALATASANGWTITIQTYTD